MAVSGIHGDEVASREVGKSLARATVPKGRLVVLPVANPYAARQGYRGIDYGDAKTWPEEFDLNRKFDWGKPPEGPVAQGVWQVVEKHSPDRLLDLHTSKGSSFGRSAIGGVGQTLWTTPHTEFIRQCQHTAKFTNEKFSIGPKNEFRVMASVNDDDEMLADRFYLQFDRPATIIEASRDGNSLATQQEWLTCVVSTLMMQWDQQPAWE